MADPDYGVDWPWWKSLDPTGLVSRAESTVAASAPTAVAAAMGVSHPPTIYETIGSEWREAPETLYDTYEFVVFWLDTAARRAAYDQNKAADQFLGTIRDQFQAKLAEIEPDFFSQEGMFERATGLVPTRGRAAVLQEGLNALKASSLAQSDKDKIVAVLESARRSVVLRQTLPMVVAVGFGSVVGLWLYRRYKQS